MDFGNEVFCLLVINNYYNCAFMSIFVVVNEFRK